MFNVLIKCLVSWKYLFQWDQVFKTLFFPLNTYHSSGHLKLHCFNVSHLHSEKMKITKAIIKFCYVFLRWLSIFLCQLEILDKIESLFYTFLLSSAANLCFACLRAVIRDWLVTISFSSWYVLVQESSWSPPKFIYGWQYFPFSQDLMLYINQFAWNNHRSFHCHLQR